MLDATDEGRARLEAMRRSRSDRFDERLADWTDAELSAFAAQLAAYNSALSDD
jgi:DNA-binding MarR family transcriptional regulator